MAMLMASRLRRRMKAIRRHIVTRMRMNTDGTPLFVVWLLASVVLLGRATEHGDTIIIITRQHCW